MIVLDTNILVRVITKDDFEQTTQAVALLNGPGPFWIGREVLLELGWTLKSSYRFSQAEVSRALHLVVSLDGVEIEDLDRVQKAIQMHAGGMDLGDAMVLAFAPPGATVVSFDAQFVRRAVKLGEQAVLVSSVLN